MKQNKVPKATLQRYPIYLKALRKLHHMGVERIMSRELGNFVDIESTTIRRDFSFIGSLGKQGYGYDVSSLIDVFNGQLGVNFDEKLILVGAGNLGRALMNYNRWNHVVGEIVCAFDTDNDKIGSLSEVPVYHLRDLKQYLPEGCRIAILTVSGNAQETVDLLIESGIVGIVNFTHEHIQAPKGVIIRTVDVVSTIQELIFQVNNF